MNIKQPIQLEIHYGEENRKDSLKAYKCENELKRAVASKEVAVRFHLYNQFHIPFFYDVKMTEPGDPTPITERFSLVELINSKLTSASVKLCLSTYEIYQKEGIEKAIANLHLQSSLTII